MECLLYVDGCVGVLFLDDNGYVDDPEEIIQEIERRVLST